MRSEKGEESSGRKASCPDSGSRQRRVWQKSRQPVKPIRRKRESQIPFDNAVQPLIGMKRNAFRCRGARLQIQLKLSA